MFKNYILSAIRNITKNAFHSAINIIGLSIGILATIFIILYIQDELSYDKHHKKHKRIYRLESDFTINNKHDKFAVTSIPLAPALKLEFPEIEEFVRFAGDEDILLKYEDKEFYEDRIFYADSTIFNVFDHKFIYGSPDKALTEVNSAVLTISLAKKLFGDENPVNKVLKTGDGINFKITAVIDDVPLNSHLKFSGLFSVSTLAERYGKERFNSLEPGNFWNISPYSYILLKENTDISVIHEKFPEYYDKYMASIGEQINASFLMMSTPLTDVHLTSKFEGDEPTGNIIYVYIFGFVAIFILIIASINYMNMATARSFDRAREVGIRKVIGAHRAQLIRQFLGESIILSIIAMIIAIISATLLLPVFNNLADKNLSFCLITNPGIFIYTLVITLLIGIISGSYPAFYLSSFLPVQVLKGSTISNRKNGTLRKILVTFQFTLSIIMIIGTILVSNQLSFLRNKDLGFDKENILMTQVQDTTFRKKIPAFKEELLQNPNITNVSTSNGLPGKIRSIIVMRVEKEDKMQEYALNFVMVDYDYIDLLNIEIIAGRNFDKSMGTDLEEGVIINEMTAKSLGWGDNAIGKKIDFGIDLDGSAARNTKVIGVVKDFNYVSLHNPIEPIGIFLSERPRYYLAVKFKAGSTQSVINYVQEKWDSFGANRTFDYSIFENQMDEMYTAEVKLGKIFLYFTVLCIFIALLGLFGLSSFIAEQRTKEIGIRKAFGASVNIIVMLLLKEFTYLILIAFIIAVPVSYYAFDNWSQNFAFHISIGWIPFIAGGLMAFVIAILTVSYHSIKAATTNPVNAIKWE